MARTKKTTTEVTTKKEVKETKNKDMYYQVVKTLKNGSVVMLKGYNKEIK